MTLPLQVLAVGAFVAGFVGIPAALGGGNAIEHFLEPSFTAHASAEAGARAAEAAAEPRGGCRTRGARGAARVARRRARLDGVLAAGRRLRHPAGPKVLRHEARDAPTTSARRVERRAPRAVEQVLRGRAVRRDGDFGGTFAAGRGLWTVDRNVVDGVVNGSGWLTIVSAWFSGLTDRTVVDGVVNLVGPHLRGRQLLVPARADRSRPELRAVDAVRHLRVRQHLSVHAVI